MNVFCICSSINTPHSFFSMDKRLEQTFFTIGSIRNKDEDSYIILCDNTPISVEIQDDLKEKVDLYINTYGVDFQSIGVPNFSYDSGKSTGESFQMLVILNELNKLHYNKCFKISGRYFLLDSFDFSTFVDDKINFREFDHGYLCFSTVLYSFSKKHESILRNFFIDYLNTRQNDLETSIHKLKSQVPDEIITLDYLAVSGFLGPTGEKIIH